GILLAQRPGLARQHQKRGLKGVLGLLLMAERISANPPDEPTVPADQGGESRLIAVHDKALEQLAVAKAALGLPFDQLADTANQRAGLPGGHNANSPAQDFLLHTARRATN